MTNTKNVISILMNNNVDMLS